MNYDYLALNELLSVADGSDDPLVRALVKRIDSRDEDNDRSGDGSAYICFRGVSVAVPRMLKSLSNMEGKTVFSVLSNHDEALAVVFTDGTVMMLVGSDGDGRVSIDIETRGIEHHFTPEQLVKAGVIHPSAGVAMRAKLDEHEKQSRQSRLNQLRKEITELERGVS